ncbi:thiosulfate sulfurtransferase [candidate division GN15 bacterium]|nr:thiosulfate sulfurtransferase [candidate division GN15 bacterium]
MGVMELSTRELAAYPDETRWQLLDVRSIDAYNGWPMRGEKRGGHLNGATAFPISWTDYADWRDVLDAKPISPRRSVAVVGYDDDAPRLLASYLTDLGYRDVAVYPHFSEWSENPALPLLRLPRYRKLIPPEWLRDLINGRAWPGETIDKYVICHASYGLRDDYEEGHIPGAVYIDTMSLESYETWNRRSPEEIEQALCELGINHDTTVILYGRFNFPNSNDPYPGQSAGHLAAIRCAAIMLYAGVKDVRVVNGGLKSWIDAGFELTTEESELRRIASFGAPIPAQPEYMIDTPDAKELLAADDGVLVSIRSWEEFIGKVSGYNYVDRAGRIPGAVFGNCGSDAYHMENYRNIDHTMREYHEIADIWARDGIVPDKHVAFYCGTGWRASEAFLNAYLMAWPRISVYDGGWFEWSNDLNNPVETGLPD